MRRTEVSQMRRRIGLRRIAAAFIALFPLNCVRCFMYRSIGYKISGSRIGWGTIIAIDQLTMTDALIGRYNKISGPLKLSMMSKSSIGSHNTLVCDFWTMDEMHVKFKYRRHMVCFERATVTNHHWFDVTDRISIGAYSYVAGIGTQFWTHGFSDEDRDISIGADCYIGAGCILTPGSAIADRCIVGAGSVVSKKFTAQFCLLAGNPTAVVRDGYYWRSRSVFDPDNPPPLPYRS